MTGRAGERKGNELWLRCPHCGDSQNDLNKAHYSVNTEGLYHCLRCGAGGRLSIKEFLNIALGEHADFIDTVDEKDWEDTLDELMPGPFYSRFSALDRFHIRTAKNNYDVFLSRNIQGDIVGLALSDLVEHKRILLGEKVLGWKGDELLSTPEDPLRLVEGPYDVVTDRDVCCYGLPRRRQLQMLRGHYVILCPDGDVWSDFTKRRAILLLLQVYDGATITEIEVLPEGIDPDDMLYADRPRITAQELKRQWRVSERRRKWSKLLQS